MKQEVAPPGWWLQRQRPKQCPVATGHAQAWSRSGSTRGRIMQLIITHNNSLGHLFNSHFGHCFEHFVCIKLSDPPNNPRRQCPLSHPFCNQGEQPRGRDLLQSHGLCMVGLGCFLHHSQHCLALVEPRAVYQASAREHLASDPNGPEKVAGQLPLLSFYG